MQYLGGKARIAKELSAFIAARHANRWLLIEPFMGGANMTEHLAPLFEQAICADAVPDLALLYTALQAGWEPPAVVTGAEYLALKHAAPSAHRGFAAFGCSFGGKYFGGVCEGRQRARLLRAGKIRMHAPTCRRVPCGIHVVRLLFVPRRTRRRGLLRPALRVHYGVLDGRIRPCPVLGCDAGVARGRRARVCVGIFRPVRLDVYLAKGTAARTTQRGRDGRHGQSRKAFRVIH